MSRKIILSVFLAAAALFGIFSPALAAETTVRTDRATKINAFDAMLNGFVDTNDDRRVNVWFEWDTRSSGYRNQTPQKYVGRTSGEDLEYQLVGLMPDTTYYFRLVAENEDGDIIRGDRKSFETDDFDGHYDPNYPYYPPYQDPYYNDPFYYGGDHARVTTLPATIPYDSSGSVILNGYVDTRGENTVRWFEWGTSRNFLSESTIAMSHGNISGNYNQFLSGLRPNTTYYFRAVAQGRGNPHYGQVLSFSVRGYIPPAPPVYPSTPTYVPPITVPVTPTVTTVPTITIPVKVNPIVTPAPEPEEEGEEEHEEGNEVEESVLGALAIFGSGFFPTTLIGWLFLLLLVVLLVYAAQKAFGTPARGHGHGHNSHTHHGPTAGHEF